MKNNSNLISSNILSTLVTKSNFTFKVRSNKNSKMNWNHQVDGLTEVSQVNNSIIFHDTILFKNNIHDYKKWIITDNKLDFWHLRFEQFIYVFSFDLDTTSTILYSTNHLCKADNYMGKIEIIDNCFKFDMYITSPIKDEHISYIYK
jgi:hypothetical protein